MKIPVLILAMLWILPAFGATTVLVDNNGAIVSPSPIKLFNANSNSLNASIPTTTTNSVPGLAADISNINSAVLAKQTTNTAIDRLIIGDGSGLTNVVKSSGIGVTNISGILSHAIHAGANITLSTNGAALVITIFGMQPSSAALTNLASGDGSGLTNVVKSSGIGVTNISGVVSHAIQAGSNITLSTNGAALVINGSAVGGSGTNILVNGSLVSGANLTNSTTLTISVSGTNISGSVVGMQPSSATLTNLASGNGSGLTNVVKSSGIGVTNISGVVSHALTAGTGIALTTNGAALQVAVGSTVVQTSGIGVTNIAGVVSHAIQAGSNITLSTNGAALVITGSAGGGGGSGTNIYVNGSLVSGANLTNSTTLTISVSGTNISGSVIGMQPSSAVLTNLASGDGASLTNVVKSSGIGVTNIAGVVSHAIQAGSNITLSTNGAVLVITAAAGGVTSGVGVTNVSGVISHAIEAGSNITLSTNGAALVIAAAAGGVTSGIGVTNILGVISHAIEAGSFTILSTNGPALVIGSTGGGIGGGGFMWDGDSLVYTNLVFDESFIIGVTSNILTVSLSGGIGYSPFTVKGQNPRTLPDFTNSNTVLVSLWSGPDWDNISFDVTNVVSSSGIGVTNISGVVSHAIQAGSNITLSTNGAALVITAAAGGGALDVLTVTNSATLGSLVVRTNAAAATASIGILTVTNSATLGGLTVNTNVAAATALIGVLTVTNSATLGSLVVRTNAAAATATIGILTVTNSATLGGLTVNTNVAAATALIGVLTVTNSATLGSLVVRTNAAAATASIGILTVTNSATLGSLVVNTNAAAATATIGVLTVTNSATLGSLVVRTNAAAATATIGVLTVTNYVTSLGGATIISNIVRGSISITPAAATNVVLDFGYPLLTMQVTNNIWLVQSTNRPAQATNFVQTLIRLRGDSVDRLLGQNATWLPLGTNYSTIPSNRLVVIEATAWGASETNVTIDMKLQL